MIARNYIKHPEALLRQVELRLDECAQYFQDLTATMRAVWTRLLAARKPAARPKVPTWFLEAKVAAKGLAAAMRATQMPLTA